MVVVEPVFGGVGGGEEVADLERGGRTVLWRVERSARIWENWRASISSEGIGVLLCCCVEDGIVVVKWEKLIVVGENSRRIRREEL